MAGRPRTSSLEPDEMIELGKEMIEWVKKHNPPHLSAWYTIEKGYIEADWETMHVTPEFLPYYEKALKIIGMQYLNKDSNISDSIKQRWQRIYFKDLKKEEDEKAKFDANLKLKVAEKESETSQFIITDQQNRIMELEAKLAKYDSISE